MHESKAYSTVFYVRNKRKKGAITTTTAVVCVYFESAENTPDMGIKILKKKKISTECLETGIIAGWHNIQISIKTHVLQMQNFVILKAANNGLLKSIVI